VEAVKEEGMFEVAYERHSPGLMARKVKRVCGERALGWLIFLNSWPKVRTSDLGLMLG
jgi:hypothetical protein